MNFVALDINASELRYLVVASNELIDIGHYSLKRKDILLESEYTPKKRSNEHAI